MYFPYFWMGGGALFSVAVVCLFAVKAVRKEKARCVALQKQLADAKRLIGKMTDAEDKYRKQIHSQQADLRNSHNRLANARAEYLYMFRNGYRRLGALYEMRQFAISQNHSGTVLLERVDDYLKEISGDPDGLKSLIKFIDDSLGNPVTDLKEDLPDLGVDDIRLFCYLVVGYDAPLISSLMGIDNLNTVYSRKNRLLGKIDRLHASKARRYRALVA